MPGYIVVEQECEFCGEINAHLTAHCPHLACKPFMFSSVPGFLGWFVGRVDTIMFLAAQFAR